MAPRWRPERHRRRARRRGQGLTRLLLLLRVLGRGRSTMREAGEEIGASYRTLYRDLHVLAELGIAVERQQEGREVYWRVRRTDLVLWLTDCE